MSAPPTNPVADTSTSAALIQLYCKQKTCSDCIKILNSDGFKTIVANEQRQREQYREDPGYRWATNTTLAAAGVWTLYGVAAILAGTVCEAIPFELLTVYVATRGKGTGLASALMLSCVPTK